MFRGKQWALVFFVSRSSFSLNLHHPIFLYQSRPFSYISTVMQPPYDSKEQKDCNKWCKQRASTELVGFSVYSGGNPPTRLCYCFYSNGLPSFPAFENPHEALRESHNGTGPVMGSRIGIGFGADAQCFVYAQVSSNVLCMLFLLMSSLMLTCVTGDWCSKLEPHTSTYVRIFGQIFQVLKSASWHIFGQIYQVLESANCLSFFQVH